MTSVQKWLVYLASTVVAITICYFWLDRPISYFAHDNLKQNLFSPLTQIPEWAERIAVAIFVILGVRALWKPPLSKFHAVVLLSSVSLVVAWAVKNELKHFFGRTWPDTWVNNNPSLIHDGVFGFNPFHRGAGYESFPSGHTTITCAVISVLWLCYPRLRPLYAVIVGLVALGLLGANYHFLGDIIGGAFIGISSGWMAVMLWESPDPHHVRPLPHAPVPTPKTRT